jgi:uncharacterized protein with PIN domain
MACAWVRCYAELNAFLPPEIRYQTFAWRFDVSPAVKAVVEGLGIPHTEVDLILINGAPAGFGDPVRDGDRVAVYPMFEAIDITPVARLRPAPLRVTRFVLDVHLGRLAAYLRMAGFDTVYGPDFADADLARISRDERRILLTRDKGLLMRNAVTHGYLVRSPASRTQLAEVLERFDLRRAVAPFRRCLRCNEELQELDRAEAAGRVPPAIARRYFAFRECPRCGRVFWTGTHHQRMRELLRGAQGQG